MLSAYLRTGPMKWPQRWVAAFVVTLPAGKGSLHTKFQGCSAKETFSNLGLNRWG